MQHILNPTIISIPFMYLVISIGKILENYCWTTWYKK